MGKSSTGLVDMLEGVGGGETSGVQHTYVPSSLHPIAWIFTKTPLMNPGIPETQFESWF